MTTDLKDKPDVALLTLSKLLDRLEEIQNDPVQAQEFNDFFTKPVNVLPPPTKN